jgi:DNA-directed RNA polymerase specialized sigma24 family protein
MAEDTFLEALTALESTLADNEERTTLIRRRIDQLRRLRSQGEPYAEIVSISDGPLIVQLVTESSTALDISGASVRRAEARALYAEGLTMDQIAERFGVTRQRVSALLRKARRHPRFADQPDDAEADGHPREEQHRQSTTPR